MNILKSLNSHLAAIAGVFLSVLGFVAQPGVSGILIPYLPPKSQAIGAAAVNLIGLFLAYIGRPVTVPKGN